jgi:hypothetical protein
MTPGANSFKNRRPLRVGRKKSRVAQQKGHEAGVSAPTQVSARPAAAAAAVVNANTSAAAALWYSPPPDPMTSAAPGDPPPPPLLGALLGSLPDLVFQQDVLKRLGPRGLASLAGAGRGCAAAAAATAIMQWAKVAKRAPQLFGNYLPPLCLNEACAHAALDGNREVLEWLHNTGCPLDALTASAAATGGHLEVLQWLRKHGCPWDESTCSLAARFGHLRVLQWAREHHCPWHSTTGAYATMYGQLEVLQWIRENNGTGPMVWNKRMVRDYAGGPRKQEVLTWLDELGDD